MKQGRIEKSQETITSEQLDKINQYTRRALQAEEVFVFSVILCDNEIDRDNERFTEESLNTLAELFLGKTGIFDHVASAENQAARIFDTLVIKKEEKNSLGETYQQLQAWAYMPRSAKNEELILEIDAGIKKEVSVGCSVAEINCSVCGNNQKTKPCKHSKGNFYGGVACHYLLEKPLDAYEWSFVAVPAQKKAGVTKRYGEVVHDSSVAKKIEQSDEEITLSRTEVYHLKGYLIDLEALAKQGDIYSQMLRKESVRYATLAEPRLDAGMIESVVNKMSLEELRSFHAAYKQATEKHRRPTSQLDTAEQKNKQLDGQFKI